MKIFERAYSFDKSKFESEIIYSCHRYLYNNIEHLNNVENIISDNSRTLNEKDLHGKYNSFNFLLECFAFHQNTRYMYYTKERNPKIDFMYISFLLIKHGASQDVPDYMKMTFNQNIQLFINSKISWHIKYSFVDDDFKTFLELPLPEKEKILVKKLKKEDIPLYNKLYLEYSLPISTINKKIKKI